MAFRGPTAANGSFFNLHDVTTAAATTTYPFVIPQDADSVIGKIFLDSTWNASGTATITIQTTEDGGTTWRDVAATTIGASTVAATMGNQNAHFIDVGCIGTSDRGVANYIGSVAASSLALAAINASAIGTQSGMPFISTIGRVQVTYTSTITTGGVNVQLFAPSQEMR